MKSARTGAERSWASIGPPAQPARGQSPISSTANAITPCNYEGCGIVLRPRDARHFGSTTVFRLTVGTTVGMWSVEMRIPSYRLHKGTGQAVVTVQGRDHYLGRHGSVESRDRYKQLIAEFLATGRAPVREDDEPITIGEAMIS